MQFVVRRRSSDLLSEEEIDWKVRFGYNWKRTNTAFFQIASPQTCSSLSLSLSHFIIFKKDVIKMAEKAKPKLAYRL